MVIDLMIFVHQMAPWYTVLRSLVTVGEVAPLMHIVWRLEIPLQQKMILVSIVGLLHGTVLGHGGSIAACSYL